MDAMKICVVSPDGNVQARISDRRQTEFSFRPGSFRKYHAQALERQLEGLASLLFVGYQRGYLQVMARESMTVKIAPGDGDGNAEREFLARRNEVAVRGRSSSRQVRVQSIGLLKWRVVVETEALESTEPEFVAQLAEATGDLLRDHAAKITELRAECFA
ncbi:MAG: hypothetical protein ACRD0P_32470 [Stackebrandtia sp.]